MRDHDLTGPKDFEFAHHDLRAGIDRIAAEGGEVIVLAHGYACNKVVCYQEHSGDDRIRRRVLTAFPNAFPAGVDAQVVGNPVRADILMQPPPAERFARREGALRLLVVGGSLGASRLNTVVPFAVEQSGLELHVRHQAGERGLDSARAAYEEAGVTADISAFITDMAQAYADADLVICRAGALTVSELAAVGVASILVPFPAAVDDHQTVNAQYLVREGAAVLIADRDLTPARLASELKLLCAGRGKLLAMGERARLVAKPRAAEDMAAACMQHLEAA